VAADIESTKVRMEVEKAGAALKTHALRLEDAKARAGLAVERAKVKLAAHGQDVDAYKAVVSSISEYGRLSIASKDSEIKRHAERLNFAVDAARLEVDFIKANQDLKLNAAVKGADIYANMVSGALSSINAIASMSE